MEKMFDFILEQLRSPWFTYADITCGSFPLDTIDTVSENGTTDTESAIYLIANGVCLYNKYIFKFVTILFLNNRSLHYIWIF